jgi:putative transposase
MKKSESLYHGHRFPAGVISCAVRWYFRFQLSLRDIEELLLFERGVTVTHETIRCWCHNCRSGATKPRPNVSSGVCCARTSCRARSFTDQLRSYRAEKAEIPELANVKHVFVKAASRLNNRAENSHHPKKIASGSPTTAHH